MCTVEQVVYVRPQTVQQTPVKLKQEILTLNTHVFFFFFYAFKKVDCQNSVLTIKSLY